MIYESLDSFYADSQPFGPDRQLGLVRQAARECDYGVWWRGEHATPLYLVRAVDVTGELILVKCGQGGDIKRPLAFEISGVYWPRGAVQVIGHFETIAPEELADGERVWYAYAELLLDDWAEHCNRPNGIRWLRDTLERNGVLEQVA